MVIFRNIPLFYFFILILKIIVKNSIIVCINLQFYFSLFLLRTVALSSILRHPQIGISHPPIKLDKKAVFNHDELSKL
jgi:hypothetical protein